MALKGSLRDFSIVQILNLVNLAKKTGKLEIQGQNRESQLVFREGKLAYVQFGSEDNSLAAILQRNHKLTQSQAVILKERGAKMTDKQLGLMLVNANYVSLPDILASLQEYYTGIIRRFFTSVDGNFQFIPDIPAPADRIPMQIDLENIIIEGSRQMREWEQLSEEIPSLEMAVKFTDRPGTNIRSLNLSVAEWQVVKFVNPKNTISMIAQATKMNELEIRRVIYALLQAGVIEIIRHGGMQRKYSAMVPGVNKEEQKSLINRLISSVRSR
jgi:hypothetical protein